MSDVLLAPLRIPYLRRALIEACMLAVLGGLVGVHVLLRRLAFLTDAVQHAVLPGLAVAFVTGTSLLLGALGAAVVAVVALAIMTRHAIDEDAALAVVISTFVAAGVLIVSRRQGFQSDLGTLLFGRLLFVRDATVIQSAAATALVALVLAAVHKELVLVAFDRAAASALGYRVIALDGVVYAIVAVAVVVCARAVGTVLAVAFLVTPAATARLITTRVGPMMLVAAGLAAVCSWIGLGVSYVVSIRHDVRLAPGATVVIAMTAVFAFVFAMSTAVTSSGRGPRKRLAPT